MSIRFAAAALALVAAIAVRAEAQQAALPGAEMWQVLPAIEANRPVMAPRALTSAERAEARKLGDAYRRGPRTRAALERLRQLAESGDRDAMVAMRNAIKAGPPAEFRAAFADTPTTRQVMTRISDSLAAVWTAQLWALHGAEAEGVPIIEPCIGGLRDAKGRTIINVPVGENPSPLYGIGESRTALGCGFQLSAKRIRQYVSYKVRNILPPGALRFEVHFFNGTNYYRKPEEDFYITGVTFFPVWGDKDFLERAFAAHLAARKSGLMLTLLGYRKSPEELSIALKMTLPWIESHARATGREAALVEADKAAEASYAALHGYYARVRNEEFTRLMAEYRASPPDFVPVELRNVAIALGGSQFAEFEALHRQRSRSAPPAPNAPAGSASNAYQSVEVRSYDSSGNYLGSTRTSAVWADIMKMTSSPAR